MKDEIKRIDYIDIFRGFGIILMIMGHINFGSIFDHYIHAFHMPMFFFITGYFYKTKSMSTLEYVIKKAKSLIVPYISFAIFHSVFYIILYKSFSIQFLYHILLINTDGMPITGALWFLTALFFVDILYYLLDKYLKDNVVCFTIVVIFMVLIGTLVPKMTGLRLPWAIDVSLVSIGFCHIGRLIGNKKIPHADFVANLNSIFTFLVIIAFSVLVFVNGYVNMRTADYAIVPLFWINSISLIIGWLNLARIVDNKLTSLHVLGWIITEMKFIGKNSIIYLCLNQFTILILNLIVDKMVSLTGITIPYIIISIVFLILTLIILHILYELFDKTKLIIMIGRF